MEVRGVAGIETADHVAGVAGQPLDLLKALQDFDALRRRDLETEQPRRALGATIGEGETVVGLDDGIARVEGDAGVPPTSKFTDGCQSLPRTRRPTSR